MKPLWGVAALGVVSLLSLSGCSSMQVVHQHAAQAYQKGGAGVKVGQEGLREVPTSPPLVDFSSLPYVDTTPIPYVGHYPPSFTRPSSIRTSAEPVYALMQQLSNLSGYYLSVQEDSGNGSGGGATPKNKQSQSLKTMMVPALSYQGTLKGLLDRVGRHLDMAWDFDRGARTISFARYQTRVFHIASVPGKVNGDLEMGGEDRSVSGNQGQSIHTKGAKLKSGFKSESDIWKSVKKNITSMLSPSGTVTLNEQNAAVTVRDRYDRMGQIAEYVRHLNQGLSTQVKINVAIYRIRNNRNDSHGFSWNALYNAVGDAARRIGASIAVPSMASVSNLSSIKVEATQGQALAGSTALINALSAFGKTSEVKHNTLITVNNVPTTFRAFQTQDYLAKTSSVLTPGLSTPGTITAVAGSSLQPGTVETGFKISILPSVQPDGRRLLLQSMISISTLDSLKSISSGGQMIQVPKVSGRSIMPRVWMRSGESLVLAGFESDDSQDNNQSALGKRWWWLGGNVDASTGKDAFVIVLTPVITSYDSVN